MKKLTGLVSFFVIFSINSSFASEPAITNNASTNPSDTIHFPDENILPMFAN